MIKRAVGRLSTFSLTFDCADKFSTIKILKRIKIRMLIFDFILSYINLLIKSFPNFQIPGSPFERIPSLCSQLNRLPVRSDEVLAIARICDMADDRNVRGI